jgi:N-acetylmuramoyl-L-alanine amidase
MVQTIMIDPGHGGNDPGAYRGSYVEKRLVLDLSLRLRKYLQDHFVCQVLMTRMEDSTLSLTQRTDYANRNRADFLISVHFNAFTSTARGYEDFVHTNITDSSSTEKIRSAIHQEVVKQVLTKYRIPDRGRKKANFHMLRESNMPAVLVETLFVSNADDQKLITNSAWFNDMVVAYGEGIGKGLGLPRKVVAVPKPTPTKPTGSLFRVQCGAFKDRRNAEALVTRLKSAGFSPFIYTSNGYYRVQVGAYSSKVNSDNIASRLRSAGFPVFIYR